MSDRDNQHPGKAESAAPVGAHPESPLQLAGCYLGDIVIAGVGYHHPEEILTNDELISAYNSFADDYNARNQLQIAAQQLPAMAKSSADFIEKASGIRCRYVRDKRNLLDIRKMHPELPERKDEELSLQAEVSVLAATAALRQAGVTADQVDAVIIASSHRQRDFPGVSVEVQTTLGTRGFAFDMGMACSSATFGIQNACGLIRSGMAGAVLVISPEIKSGQVCMTDRDSNFIFGEATSALLIQRADRPSSAPRFRIKDIGLKTQFSNNIRNNRGAYNNTAWATMFNRDKFFYQKGRAVYKEITAMVPAHILAQLNRLGLDARSIKRFWLHQSNLKMNRKIVANLLGDDVADIDCVAPSILHEFGNTSSSGSIIAFAKYSVDLAPGDLGIICSFGAGYSIGSVLLEKL